MHVTNYSSANFLPLVSGNKKQVMAPSMGITAKAIGGSQAAKTVRPATYGANIDPTLDTVDEAPMAILRFKVGNNSEVYMYLQ